jgi:hypothetical protein
MLEGVDNRGNKANGEDDIGTHLGDVAIVDGD